jgi:hypothetical protein
MSLYSKTDIWSHGTPLYAAGQERAIVRGGDYDPGIPEAELKTFLIAQNLFDPDDPHITADGITDPHPGAIADAPFRDISIARPYKLHIESLLDIPDFSDQQHDAELRGGPAQNVIDYDMLPELWDMMPR